MAFLPISSCDRKLKKGHKEKMQRLETRATALPSRATAAFDAVDIGESERIMEKWLPPLRTLFLRCAS